MILLNTIAGDIIGSKYELDPIHTKEFELFQNDMYYTDDTVLTIATIDALIEINEKYTNYSLKNEEPYKIIDIFRYYYHKYGNLYNEEKLNYGSNFIKWLKNPIKKAYPYNSFGNGSAMRVSPIAYYSENIKEAEFLAWCSACATHNHPLGSKGAIDIVKSIFKFLQYNETKETILKETKYKIPLNLKESLFDESCEGTLPFAYKCFIDSNSVEDAIRNAISCGEDSDTLGIITASLAEAYYGEDEKISENVIKYLDDHFINKIKEFEIIVLSR